MSKIANESNSLLSSFPYSLSRDVDKQKLAESIADDLSATVVNTDKALIFPVIDVLPETVLDMLAYDFKVEWYEYSAPIQNKRQTIKECILVHKHKGTKYAVETAVHSLYGKAEVTEWFEYGGEPFHFRITVFGSSSYKIKQLGPKILYAKNLRSVLESVIFVLIPDSNLDVFVGIKNAALHKKTVAEICYDDDAIFTAPPFSSSVGIGVCGKMKRIYSRLEYAGAASLKNICIRANVGISAENTVKKIYVEVMQP